MHSRREYTPHFTIETIESADKNGSPRIRTTENIGQNFRSAIETQPRNRSFSPQSPATPTYDYKSLPRFSDADSTSPSGSLRKIVTISRRESPSHSSAFNRPQQWSASSDVMYNNSGDNNDSKYYRSYTSNDRQSIADPVYKTTMITQVKPPTDATDAVYRSYPEQHNYAKQPEQPFIRLSVKHPQQQHNQQIKIHYLPEADRNSYFSNDSHKQSPMYSSQLPQLSNHPSNQSSNYQSTNQSTYQPSKPSSQPSDNHQQQHVISSYKPTYVDNQPYLSRLISPNLPIIQTRTTAQPDATKHLDDYDNTNYTNNNNNNYYYNKNANNTNNLYKSANNNLNNSNNIIINGNLNNNNSNTYSNSNNINNSSYNYSNNKTSSHSNSNSSNNSLSKEAEVDVLTNLLVENMRLSAQPDFYGMCVKCSRSIMGETNGCTILNHTYHLSCFLCSSCSCTLVGQSFFCLDGDSFCEDCYMKTVENCSVCDEPIIDRLLKAADKNYHVGCFKCGECGVVLDGCPFNLDAQGGLYCLPDYQRKYAKKCASCTEAITSPPGQREVLSVLFNHCNYHLHCFKCHDCGIQLSTASKGNGCFTMDAAILCKSCHMRRMPKIANNASTEL